MSDLDLGLSAVSHRDAYNQAIAAGCMPVWYDGILGPAWHCGCDEDGPTHCIDQQCSVVKFYREEYHYYPPQEPTLEQILIWRNS